MATIWLTTMKPGFTNEWLVLPPKEARQVLEKINLLAKDPTPDAKVKKQLKHIDPRLHRIRAGDYRIFYTFEEPYISLLAIRRRLEDTYDEDLDVEFLGGLDPEFEDMSGAKATQPNWEKWLASKEPEKRRLPEPITKELLANLHIPQESHTRLLKIDDYLFERPLVEVLQQPDYLLNDVGDLLR